MGRNYPIWKVSVFGKWVSAKASRERHCTTADCCGAAPSLAASAACLSQCVAFTLPPSRCARRQRQEHEQDSPDCSRRQSQCWRKRTLLRSYQRTPGAWQLSQASCGTAEIGRASCRECVWRYVYVWVVAWSIKKKHG